MRPAPALVPARGGRLGAEESAKQHVGKRAVAVGGEVAAVDRAIGAGIGGLNALYVASRYLRDDQRVALVDKRHSIGGMWVDTYDYVRLHQPHPFFTTGDVKWTFGKEPSHLASKDEVLQTVFRENWSELLQRFEQVEASDEPADEMLRGIVKILLRTWRNDPDLVTVMVREVAAAG